MGATGVVGSVEEVHTPLKGSKTVTDFIPAGPRPPEATSRPSGKPWIGPSRAAALK
jgi:hypothetical protein